VAFQVNYLAPYLLTTKLSSKLAGACGRVINVSSVTHRGGNIFWKGPGGGCHYSPLEAYA
jgi:NAD(P)-dependent dehydrogenase (short-subunit alcohol dehydrogenase family)